MKLELRIESRTVRELLPSVLLFSTPGIFWLLGKPKNVLETNNVLSQLEASKHTETRGSLEFSVALHGQKYSCLERYFMSPKAMNH